MSNDVTHIVELEVFPIHEDVAVLDGRSVQIQAFSVAADLGLRQHITIEQVVELRILLRGVLGLELVHHIVVFELDDAPVDLRLGGVPTCDLINLSAT